MPIPNPPVWIDPNTTAVDPSGGIPLPASVFDAIAADLAILGGSTGGLGIAGKGNILVNGGFEVWQRGTSFTGLASLAYGPDRWQWTPGGTSTVNVTQEASIILRPGAYAMDCIYTHNANSYMQQKIESGFIYASQPVSLSVMLKTNSAGASVTLYDGTAGYSSLTHPGDGNWHMLTVTATLAPTASVLDVQLNMTVSGTYTWDNAMLVWGNAPSPYIPLGAAEEYQRCLRYYEILGESANGALIIQGYLAASGAIYLTVPYKVRKPFVPTVTKNGTWSTANCTSTNPVVDTIGVDSVRLAINTTAAGQANAQNNGSGCTITVSADAI